MWILTHLRFSRQTVLEPSVKFHENQYCGGSTCPRRRTGGRRTDGQPEKYDNEIRKFVSNPKVTSKHSKYKESKQFQGASSPLCLLEPEVIIL